MFKVIASARKHDLFLVEVATERMKGFELFLSQRVVKTKPMQSPFNI